MSSQKYVWVIMEDGTELGAVYSSKKKAKNAVETQWIKAKLEEDLGDRVFYDHPNYDGGINIHRRGIC